MKTAFSSFLVFVSVTLSSLTFGQDPDNWTLGYVPFYRHMNAVEILPNDKIIAVGGWQFNDAITTIHHSSDSGATWNIAMDMVNAWMLDVHFPSLAAGYVVGWAGKIYKSTNQGNNWTLLPVTGSAATRNFNGCHFFDDNTGVVVGGNQSNDAIRTIIRTTDGGANWSIISDNLNPWLRGVHFGDNTTGYAVGDAGTILKSTNAGVSWAPLTVPGSVSSRQFNAVHFRDANNGIVVGGWPSNDSIKTILRTTDGGANWSVIMDNLGGMLHGVHFYDDLNGFAVGDQGLVFATYDGGASWTELAVTGNNNIGLRDVFFKNEYFGIASGRNGKMLRYIDGDAGLAAGMLNSPVTLVNANSVFITGQVDDLSLPATLEFEYGTTMSFGSSIPMSPSPTLGLGLVDVELNLTGLTPDVVYYGRMKMTNTLGESFSNTISFYTGLTTVPNFSFEFWDEFSKDVLDEWQNEGVVAQVTSYNGSRAVRISGGTDDNVGAILHAIPSDEGLSGGIPFTERPDSMSVWMNYSIEPNDTALIIVQMRKDGNVIADSIYKLTGNSSGNFMNLKFGIDYYTSDFPDTLAFGIASSNVFSGNVNPLSVLTIDDITFDGATTFLPNHDMEDWSTDYRYKASSWISGDDLYPANEPFIVDRSSDAFEGNYALKLSNKITDNWSNWALVKTGTELWSWDPVFPVSYNHENLYGYYKFNRDDEDTLFVRVSLFENGTQMGWGNIHITESVSEYTLFTVPINAWSGTADSALIEFSIYKNNGGQPGNSFALIDNLSFDVLVGNDATAVVEELVNPREVILYPNPTEGSVTVSFSDDLQENVGVMVVDLAGRVLDQWIETPLNSKIQFDLNTLNSGQYFIIVTVGAQMYSFKTLVK
jgi:photosystem II stability/assembly factor-like uncharacterized protein